MAAFGLKSRENIDVKNFIHKVYITTKFLSFKVVERLRDKKILTLFVNHQI